ncbi:MAG: LLM class flavin-dependent oxidoreductase [Acidimicrobiia bacterium]|nr:LLM class flavin-dependent oxidoreductase [Acidimicrobiia bacterium]
MDVGYGLVSCQLTPGDRRGWEDLYGEALDLAQVAESAGLDSVWTTEHHFVDDGYMPSLLVTSAAIAARTERIRIGTGVLLAPLHHPLRLAEDAATVSLLSKGRLILGLGLGWSPVEYDGLGADLRTRGAVMSEILTILPRAWSGEPIDWGGPHHPVGPYAVRPIPEHPIPIWIGGGADAAVRRAALQADGFFSNALPDRFVEQVAVAGAARREAGIDTPFGWAYYGIVHVCDDADAGWEEIRDSVRLMTWKYSDMVASATRAPGAIPSPPPMDAATEEALRSRVMVGTAEQIAEQILSIRRAAGVDFDFMARSYFPDRSLAALSDQIHRIGDELAPLLRA